LWTNTSEGNSITIKAHNAPVRSVNYSYDGQLLLTGSDDKTLHVYKVENQKLLFELKGHLNWVKTAIFSPDNRIIASGG